MATAAVPAHVIDALTGLLEAESGSVFRFINEGTPYVSRATAEVRRPLGELGRLCQRHSRELANLIESVGGALNARPAQPRMEDQYLAYLSLQFLLPKLVREKQLILQRYENAKRAIGRKDFPEIVAELDRIESEEAAYVNVLRQAAYDATGGRYKDDGDEAAPIDPAPKDSEGERSED
jgi:hypothetical protein